MIRENLSEELKAYYGELENVDCSQAELLKKTNYFLFTISLYRLPDLTKIDGKNKPIYVYYLSTGRKRPVVNCTDILGGTLKWNEEEKRATANYPVAFINAIACVLFKRWNAFIVGTNNKALFDDADSPENFELGLKNVAYNNIQAIRFVKTLPTTDANRIYAIGVSLGALTLSAIAGIEDTYKKIVVILGGYPLDGIIATSDEGMVKGFFERMQFLYGDDAQDLIKKAIHNSNETYKYIPKNSVFQVASTGDTAIPDTYQYKFTDLVQPKETFQVNYNKFFAKMHKTFINGHYQTLLYYPYLMYRSIKYLGGKS